MMGMSVDKSSKQYEGSTSPSRPVKIGEFGREDPESWDLLEETALSDRVAESCEAKVKNFVIDGELMSGTESEASAPAVINSDNLPEWLDASVDEEAEQRESGNIRVEMD